MKSPRTLFTRVFTMSGLLLVIVSILGVVGVIGFVLIADAIWREPN